MKMTAVSPTCMPTPGTRLPNAPPPPPHPFRGMALKAHTAIGTMRKLPTGITRRVTHVSRTACHPATAERPSGEHAAASAAACCESFACGDGGGGSGVYAGGRRAAASGVGLAGVGEGGSGSSQTGMPCVTSEARMHAHPRQFASATPGYGANRANGLSTAHRCEAKPALIATGTAVRRAEM